MSLKQTTGSRAQVMHGTAKKTSGGLTKSQLKYNKQGKIVSKKASALAKKNNRLVKAGYVTRKGVFGSGGKMMGGENNNYEITGQINSHFKIKFFNKPHWDTFKSISTTNNTMRFTIDDSNTEVEFSLKSYSKKDKTNKVGAQRYNLTDTDGKTYRVDIYKSSEVIDFDSLLGSLPLPSQQEIEMTDMISL